MKKCLALLLTLVCMITLVACKAVNWVPPADQAPQIAGVVIEVHNDSYLIECETGDGYLLGIADGTQVTVSRNLRNDPNCSVGDRILVTFNGRFQGTHPLVISSPFEIGKLEPKLTDDTGNSIE